MSNSENQNISNDLMTTDGLNHGVQVPKNPSPKAVQLAHSLKSSDMDSVTQFGLAPQSHLSQISDKASMAFSARQVGEIGKQLSDLMVTLKTSTTPDELKSRSLIGRIFNRGKREVLTVKSTYQSVGASINEIAETLKESSGKLQKNNQTLRALYIDDQKLYEELGTYIDGGLLKIDHMDKVEIPKLLDKVENSTGVDKDMAVQALNNKKSYRERLSKRVYDLQLAQQMTYQQMPQIQMIASNNHELRDKINEAITMSIPAWKNQISQKLALLDQERALKAVRNVTDVTNDLIRQNAADVKRYSLETAKESQRGIIDEETLVETQQAIIDTIKSYQEIIDEGNQKRDTASKRLKELSESWYNQVENASRRTIHAEEEDETAKWLTDDSSMKIKNPVDDNDDW